jgi:hypothetical protein
MLFLILERVQTAGRAAAREVSRTHPLSCAKSKSSRRQWIREGLSIADSPFRGDILVEVRSLLLIIGPKYVQSVDSPTWSGLCFFSAGPKFCFDFGASDIEKQFQNFFLVQLVKNNQIADVIKWWSANASFPVGNDLL